MTSFERKRALVIDDEVDQHILLKGLLSYLGFVSVDFVKTGHDALKKLDEAQAKDRAYSLVLCDWNMAGMDGLATFHAIKKNRYRPSPIFIMVTGVNTQEQVALALKQGIQHYLLKPLNKEILENKLKSIFDSEENN